MAFTFQVHYPMSMAPSRVMGHGWICTSLNMCCPNPLHPYIWIHCPRLSPHHLLNMPPSTTDHFESLEWQLRHDPCIKCMWVLFGLFSLFSILKSINVTTSISWCTRKSTMKHQQEPYWKLDLPLLSRGYWKCTFVDSSTEYTFPSQQC